MIEFDPIKAAANRAKHGIDFADVEPVFHDPMAFTSDKVVHCELRHVTTGTDALSRVVTVVWTQRGARHRLISARPATRKERQVYAA